MVLTWTIQQNRSFACIKEQIILSSEGNMYITTWLVTEKGLIKKQNIDTKSTILKYKVKGYIKNIFHRLHFNYCFLFNQNMNC